MSGGSCSESQAQLTVQLLEWVSCKPRSYAQTMEAWRTSCPRNSIWEDALASGLVQVGSSDGRGIHAAPVIATVAGLAALAEARDASNRVASER